MPEHPPIILDSRDRQRRQAERAREERFIAALHHEQSRPVPAPVFTGLANTSGNACATERGAYDDTWKEDMKSVSTPDIERGVKLLTRVCVILSGLLLIAVLLWSLCQ